jgi:hypothetical protein
VKHNRFLGLLLAVVILPFLLTGILVATKAAAWVTDTKADQRSLSFLVVALCLVLPAILVSGLVAYGGVVFFIRWFQPNSRLLAFADIESGLGRCLNPAFRAVHTFAIRLAPKRS